MEKNSTTLPAVTDLSKMDRLLKPALVAQIMGVSASFVYRLIREGTLPAVRLGTAVRVHPAALAKYIDKFPLG